MPRSSALPLYRDREEHNIENEKPKRCWRMIDYSEPLFGLSALSGLVGVIVNTIETESFDIYLGAMCSLMSFVGMWRVRKLGVAKKLMESVDTLRTENQQLNETQESLEEENNILKETNDSLKKTEKSLSTDIKKLRKLTGIVDTQNKTADEIQKEMIVLVDQYRKENRRQERNNKIALFYTADMNRDGTIEGEELEVLKQALEQEYDLNDLDSIFNGTMSRKAILERLFQKT